MWWLFDETFFQVLPDSLAAKFDPMQAVFTSLFELHRVDVEVILTQSGVKNAIRSLRVQYYERSLICCGQ